MPGHRDPSPEAIREQLGHILSSSVLQEATSLVSFLRFVVEETLAGRADRIKGYTVAVQALGRPADFDPQSDTIVRVQARRLRRALSYYYFTEGSRDSVLIDIPRGSYVPVFHHRRASPGLERRGKPGNMSGIPPASQDLPYVTPPSWVPGGPTVLVMPFDTVGDDVQQIEGQADGLARALVAVLARSPELLVIGPLSRERLRSTGTGPRLLAQEYGARFLLDGHLRQQSGRLRLSIRLVDVASGNILWAEMFDSGGRATDPFAFEDTVASQVAAMLGDTYSVIGRALTRQALSGDSLEIYDALLRYYHFSAEFPQEEQAATRAALERAAETGSHPVILAALADMHLIEYQMGGDDTTLEAAEVLICRALSLDPECRHAHCTLAVLGFLRGQRDLVVAEAERVITRGTYRPDLLALCGLHLALVGQWERGMALMDRAARFSPHLSSTYRIGPFMYWYRQGQYYNALTEAQHIHAPGVFLGPLLRAAALAQFGRLEEAQTAWGQVLALRPDASQPGRARDLLRRWVFSDENVELLMTGLQKAGLR